MPQYMLLIYTPHDRPPSDDPGLDLARWMDFTKGLEGAGMLVSSHRLHESDSATTIRVRDGETLVTDGPFAETNEYLGGYYLIECPNLDVALEQAGRLPHLHYGSVEVRPVMAAGPTLTPSEQAAASA